MESKKLETEENVMEIDQFLMPFYIVEKKGYFVPLSLYVKTFIKSASFLYLKF